MHSTACGHLREVTRDDVEIALARLRGHRHNTLTALRLLFRCCARQRLIFSKPAARVRAAAAPTCKDAVMDPAAVSPWRRLTRAVVYAVVVAVPLAMLAFLVRTQYDPLVTLDQDLIVAATDYTLGHPRFRSFVETWEMISQPWVMFLFLGLPVSLYVWFGKHLRTRAWWALATMAAGWAIAAVLKLLVRRARPEIDDPFAQHAGFSFPSGHATNNAIVVTVVVLLIWPVVGTGLRRLLVGLGAVWVIVTCADRLFAGAHFLSDVTAGVLLGCGLTAASYAGYVGWRPPTPTDSTTKGSD